MRINNGFGGDTTTPNIPWVGFHHSHKPLLPAMHTDTKIITLVLIGNCKPGVTIPCHICANLAHVMLTLFAIKKVLKINSFLF